MLSADNHTETSPQERICTLGVSLDRVGIFLRRSRRIFNYFTDCTSSQRRSRSQQPVRSTSLYLYGHNRQRNRHSLRGLCYLGRVFEQTVGHPCHIAVRSSETDLA